MCVEITIAALSNLNVDLNFFSFPFSLSLWNIDMWMNKDESWNFPQDFDPEMIKEEKRKELELEIRVQVCLHLLQ